MSELKIRVTWDGMAIELEGGTESVKEIFNSLKDSGMGRMGECSKKNISVTTETSKISNDRVIADVNVDRSEENEYTEIPSLSNVVLTGGPRTESEWMLVYAFYCSEQGAQFFSKDDLRHYYKDTNRYTEARGKNFASNFKSLISDKLISAVNQNDFRIEKKALILRRKLFVEKLKKKVGRE